MLTHGQRRRLAQAAGAALGNLLAGNVLSCAHALISQTSSVDAGVQVRHRRHKSQTCTERKLPKCMDQTKGRRGDATALQGRAQDARATSASRVSRARRPSGDRNARAFTRTLGTADTNATAKRFIYRSADDADRRLAPPHTLQHSIKDPPTTPNCRLGQ